MLSKIWFERAGLAVALWLLVLLHGGQTPLLAQGEGWITFEKCPVMVEYAVEIPAQERGIVRTVAVELNQAVEAGTVLAEFDTELAEMELRAAKLEHSLAAELAEDNSNVDYHRVALAKVEEELASHRSISTSVSESEIRRLTLGVDQAKLSLVRAMHAKKTAVGQAQLKQAAVEVAALRLARRRITAPGSGIITALKIHPGQSVEAGQTIMELRNLESLIVDRLVSIHQLDVAELVGADVRVDVERSDGSVVRLSGAVVSYDPQVSAQGFVRVHARIQNLKKGKDWILLPGREVSMHVAQPPSGVARLSQRDQLTARDSSSEQKQSTQRRRAQ
ncbi:MAG: HlyD family efflux transporter periplasmic adaptor subunit [Planctomycetales bacterium]|nr:HlyD family efflux transporter periplasmic adaptor subunit [Planctomycetales bacterium]